MRSFLIAWLVAFCLVAVIASAVSWYVGKATPPPVAPVAAREARVIPGQEIESTSAQPFSQFEAIQVVAARLPADASGDLSRQQLQTATVSYYSVQHWRICFDNACWIAHGPGRYAEPENDLARQREGRSSAAP